MSKAEDKAFETYPDFKGKDSFSTANINKKRKLRRQGFIEGYHQAEKDLELTWEDIREICRMWIESKTPFGVTGEALSIEVLKRFKERKEKLCE